MIITANVSFAPFDAKKENVSALINKFHSQLGGAECTASAHATGINVQGEAKAIFATLEQAISSVHDAGVGRVFTTLVIDSQTAAPLSLSDKLARISA